LTQLGFTIFRTLYQRKTRKKSTGVCSKTGRKSNECEEDPWGAGRKEKLRSVSR
jgi:hypothetical protein